MHYYNFNIGDYASHTRNLSQSEDLAYRRLLDEYYLHERPLNACSASVARQIGMSDQQAAVEYVLQTFFHLTDEGWSNKRVDEEIAKFRAKSEQASNAGKASAQRRMNASTTDVQRPLNDRSTDVQPTKNQEPITNKQETTIASADAQPRQDVGDKPYQPKAQVLRLNVQWTEEGFDIPSSIKTGFLTAYPAIKLDAEIAKAHAWVLSHPKNRKSNWGRFLNNWLQKAQDKAPTVTSWKDDPRFKGLA
jgi:uncharacterized protein YdaU (DUF1376 family)